MKVVQAYCKCGSMHFLGPKTGGALMCVECRSRWKHVTWLPDGNIVIAPSEKKMTPIVLQAVVKCDVITCMIEVKTSILDSLV